jgi:uncharacterized protein YegL
MSEQTLDTPLTIGKIESPRQFGQLGVLVVDGSGSMTESAVGNITKAQATNNAIREMFTRFKASRVAKNFSFAIVAFDDKVSVRLPPTDVGPFLDDNADYNPLQGHGGDTRIHLALDEAERLANDFIASAPAGGVPHSAIILVMSDGNCGEPSATKASAARIKTGPNAGRIRICSTLFARVGNTDAAGEALLKEIATDPVMGYKTVYDGETLRNFFERSISAASGGIQIV